MGTEEKIPMANKEVIIYGGCGQLGRAVLNLFKQIGYKTISIDRVENDQADQNIIVLQDTLKEQGTHVLEALASCESVPGELKVNQSPLSTYVLYGMVV